jgi:hypothetical protein
MPMKNLPEASADENQDVWVIILRPKMEKVSEFERGSVSYIC